MAEHTVTMESTLEKLLEEKKYATLRDILVTMNPADIAGVFDGMEEQALPLRPHSTERALEGMLRPSAARVPQQCRRETLPPPQSH